MLRRKLIQYALVGFLLVGCVPPANISATTITPLPIQTKEITPTVVLPPTQTPTPLPPHPVIEECASVSQTKPKIALNGILAMREIQILGSDAYGPNINILGYLLDLESGSYRFLAPPGRLSRLEEVSPDRTKLLYTYDDGGTGFGSYHLVVADFQGKTLADFPSIDRSAGYSLDYYFWLNNTLLRTSENDFSNKKLILATFNPFTREYTLLKTDWENYYGKKGPDWFLDREATDYMIYDGANIVYNPTMTRVLYPQNDGRVALADVATGNILGVYQPPQRGSQPLWGRMPRWSINGEKLFIVFSEDPARPQGSDEFYLVTQDGTFQRFTQLTQLYDTVHIANYAWSPNDNKVAFWVNTVEGEFSEAKPQSTLMILDIQTGQVTNLCIQGVSAFPIDPDPNTITGPGVPEFRPIWSPDGKQIMLAQADWNNSQIYDTQAYDIVVVDLETKTAWVVDKNKLPVGWMVKESE